MEDKKLTKAEEGEILNKTIMIAIPSLDPENFENLEKAISQIKINRNIPNTDTGE